MEVALKLVINVTDDGAETRGGQKTFQYNASKHTEGTLTTNYCDFFIPVLAVDGVSVSRRVYHSETELHSPLLDFYR